MLLKTKKLYRNILLKINKEFKLKFLLYNLVIYIHKIGDSWLISKLFTVLLVPSE